MQELFVAAVQPEIEDNTGAGGLVFAFAIESPGSVASDQFTMRSDRVSIRDDREPVQVHRGP